MHVLILSQGYPTQINPIRGIFFRDQAEALFKSGVKVGVIAIVPVSVKDLLGRNLFKLGTSSSSINGVVTIVSTYINMPKNPRYCVNMSVSKGLKYFDEYIEKYGKPDIIHVHRYESGLLAIKLKEKHKIPYVVTEHSTLFYRDAIPKIMEPIAKKVFYESSKNLAVSENFAVLLSKKYMISFDYLPNVVNTDNFSHQSLSKPYSNFVFFHAAQLSLKKNQKALQDLLLTV